ncbi:hypothetical protein G5I_06936 [Acromyrmex echinatior]|uniref:Uncharacterized protein n=1 Tax=Acromyrmex echinatior TaxID=103372 RepID=F4WMA2_ACREC|nr:hypothetical protein G5I_06936 [Acromyrmex echinatior]
MLHHANCSSRDLNLRNKAVPERLYLHFVSFVHHDSLNQRTGSGRHVAGKLRSRRRGLDLRSSGFTLPTVLFFPTVPILGEIFAMTKLISGCLPTANSSRLYRHSGTGIPIAHHPLNPSGRVVFRTLSSQRDVTRTHYRSPVASLFRSNRAVLSSGSSVGLRFEFSTDAFGHFQESTKSHTRVCNPDDVISEYSIVKAYVIVSVHSTHCTVSRSTLYLRNVFRMFSEHFQKSPSYLKSYDNVALESPKVNSYIIGLVHLTGAEIFSVVILTRWSAVPDDDALARRPDGGSCGAALHSGGCARNGTHSISARWSMRRKCGGDAEEMPPCVKSSLGRTFLSRNKLSTKSGAETNELLAGSKLGDESSWGRYLIRH